MRVQKEIVIFVLTFAVSCMTNTIVFGATGTIDSSYSYAWGENMGWINFAPTNGGLVITDSAITGHAWSSRTGWIVFSPTGTDAGVTNTPDGVLGGYAWSANMGWISMSGATIGSDGVVRGIVGNHGSRAGRINFDCVECDVRTDWRPISARAVAASVLGGNSGGGGGIFIPTPAPAVPPGVDASTDSKKQKDSESEAFPSFAERLKKVSIAASSNVQAPVVPANEKKSAPVQLFDIKLELESAVIAKASDLVGRVRFESFGTVATHVDLDYRIVNASGTEMYSQKGTTVVETEQIVTKTFEGLSLSPGKYALVLSTTYNGNVKDEFRQSFEVQTPQQERSVLVGGILGIITALAGAIFVSRYYQNKKKQ